MSVSINGTTGWTFSDATTQNTGGYTGFRNRIINGAMTIDQRNAGASVTPADTVFTLDRWSYNADQASKGTIQQNAGAITPPAGYANYLGFTSTSSYAVGSSELFAIRTTIEGSNFADMAFGTPSASSITLSFWVRSSLTGTFGGAVENSGGSRSYVFSYTINAANTWEQKTITIAGDTSGTWLTTNGIGLTLRFGLGVGSNSSTTAGAWSSTRKFSATGAQSIVGTSGATFYITGVQLEKGSVATPFEFRPYGTELSLCQRYYETGSLSLGGYGVTSSIVDSRAYNTYSFKEQKRATPTINYSGTSYTNETLTGGSVWSNPATNPTYNTITINEITLGTKIGTAAGSAVFNFFTYFTATSEL